MYIEKKKEKKWMNFDSKLLVHVVTIYFIEFSLQIMETHFSYSTALFHSCWMTTWYMCTICFQQGFSYVAPSLLEEMGLSSYRHEDITEMSLA